MDGLIEALKNSGITNIANTLNQFDQTVSYKIIKWVKNESGVDLYKAGINGENLSPTDLRKLKDIDLKFSIKFNPRINRVDDLSRAVGPISGLLIIIFCIILDSYIIYSLLESTNIIQGMKDLNAFVTLVTGYYHAKAGEIVSYWYGAAQQREKPKN